MATVVEGPLSLEPSESAFGPDFLWPDLADRFARALEQTSLEALCRESARADVQRAPPEAPMYFI